MLYVDTYGEDEVQWLGVGSHDAFRPHRDGVGQDALDGAVIETQ